MKFKTTFLIATSTAVLLAGCSASPESTVKSFYGAVAKGEITEARTYLSTQIVAMLGEARIKEELAGRTESIGKCGGIKDIDVKLEGQGEVRSGQTTVTYIGSCQPKTEKTRLIKEDGKWRIGGAK